MALLINRWFPKSGEQNSIDDDKRYGYFALGAVLDGLSFYHNISQHTVCLSQLESLPRILSNILDNDTEAYYLIENKVDEIYWNDCLIRFQKKIELNKVNGSAEHWIKQLLETSDFVSYISNLLHQKENDETPTFIKDEDLQDFTKVLMHLSPVIERRVLSAHINSPTPFYLLARQAAVFKPWYLLWLFQNIEQIKDDANSIIKDPETLPNSFRIANLESWKIRVVHCFKTQGKTFVGIAGPYIEKKIASEEVKLDKALVRLMKDKNCKLLGQKKDLFNEEESFKNALNQRLHNTKDGNHKRLYELKRAWQVLCRIQVESVDNNKLGIKELLRLAIAICWLARYESYPGLSRPKEGWRFSITSNSNLKEKSIRRQYYALSANINKEIKISCHTHYIETNIRPIGPADDKNNPARWIQSPTSIENQILANRQNLHRNVAEQMSRLLQHSTGINYFDRTQTDDAPHEKNNSETDQDKVSHEVKKVCDSLCSLLTRATGADSVQLFIVNHSRSNKKLLSTLGIYARNPRWYIPEKITQHLNKTRDEVLEKGPHAGLPKSFVIRSIFTGSTVFENKLDDSNSHFTNAYKPNKPRSGIAIPLLIHGRILGVLQVKGTEINQFDEVWKSMFTQSADLIAPYLYQLRLANILSRVQQQLAQDLDLESQSDQLDQVATELCGVLLIDHVHLLFREGEHFMKFRIKGRSSYKDKNNLPDELSNLIINILSDEPEVDHHLSSFPGLTKGSNSIYIDNKNRFDYLHCKYDPNLDILDVKQYPLLHRTTNTAHEIQEFLSSQPDALKKLFKIQDNKTSTGFYYTEEIIIFPIVSSPPSQSPHYLFDKNGLTNSRLLGFAIACNKTHRPIGRNWESIIQFLAQAIGIGVDHQDQLFTSKTESERLLRHEVKSYTIQISRSIDTIRAKAEWLHRKKQRESESYNSELDNISKIANTLKDIDDNLIPELHLQVETLKNSPLWNRLGIDQTIQPKPVDVIEELHNVIDSFEAGKREKRVIIDTYDLNKSFFAEVQPVVLRHIFGNILTNIMKYTAKDTEVKIYSPHMLSRVITIENKVLVDELKKDKAKSYGALEKDSEGVGLAIINTLCYFFLKREAIIEKTVLSASGKKPYHKFSITLDFTLIAD